MNPFDFYGPEFLLFFLIFGAVVVSLACAIRMKLESYTITPAMQKELAEDPYTTACLLGGKAHLLSVTVLSLLDRKLLDTSNNTLRTTNGLHAVETVRRPIEKAILQCCISPHTMAQLYTDGNISLVYEQITGSLRGKGLLPDNNDSMYRATVIICGLVLLWGVSLTKIEIALERGHQNIGFLIILSIIATVVLLKLSLRSRTTAGDQMLKRLKTVFASLKSRARYYQTLGNDTNQLTLLASVYGFSVLPYAVANKLRPLHVGTYAGSAGGDGGSSCGSSGGGGDSGGGGGDGGGGGCGGGGCGGCG